MDAFFNFLSVLIGGFFAFLITLIFAISLKSSWFTSNLIRVLSYLGIGISTAALISPVDLIPDAIPVAGQADDVMYLIGLIASAAIAYFNKRNQVEEKC